MTLSTEFGGIQFVFKNGFIHPKPDRHHPPDRKPPCAAVLLGERRQSSELPSLGDLPSLGLLFVSLDTPLNIPTRPDTPTGFLQTPATPSPGSPLDTDTFDRLFARVFAYNERIRRHSEDRYLDLAGMTSLTSMVYGVLPTDLTELHLNATYIVELDCALLPDTLEFLDLEDCWHLKRILNLDRLPVLSYLNVSGSSIASLPRLPASLTTLKASFCRKLTSLPLLLRTKLRMLTLYRTPIVRLPDLPETMWSLDIALTNVRGEDFPMIPDSLSILNTDGTPAVEDGFLPSRTEPFSEYAVRVRTFWNACLRKSRYDALFEELMMAAWHPDRVSKWLDQGEDVLDMMMGV